MKIKNIITIEDRISLFQTSMNNVGRNYNGRRVDVNKMAKFAANLYALAIKEISNIGKVEIEQLERMVVKSEKTKKKLNMKDIKKLMKKVKKNKRRK